MEEHAHLVSEILDRFQAEYVPNLATRTQRDYARHITKLRQEFGHRIANELKARDFRDFMNVTKGKIHRNRLMAVLSCAFSESVGRWYWMDQNPCRDVKRHPSRPRDREVIQAEYDAFKARVPLRMQLAMELSVLTGQRQGDILALRWTQVDRSLGKIRFKQAKTGKRLAVKITDAVNAVLEKCHGLCPTAEYVITRRDGNRYSSDGFRAIWQRHQRKWKRDGFERFTYHDLRAKAAGDCKTIEEAMLLLGHQNISMTRRVYDRIEREVSPTR
jgi:integrase